MLIDGTPVLEYGANQKLDCETDWVAACSYHYAPGNSIYHFPVSRHIPGNYPTAASDWKEEIINTTTCYSCLESEKRDTTQSACRSCRTRIFSRDNHTCQHQGCTTDTTNKLVIHHLWYHPNPVTGTMPDRYLIVLCNEHHKQRHGIPG
jgi:5-methylcytosine-specific restriction endonuclease McrA